MTLNGKNVSLKSPFVVSHFQAQFTVRLLFFSTEREAFVKSRLSLNV